MCHVSYPGSLYKHAHHMRSAQSGASIVTGGEKTYQSYPKNRGTCRTAASRRERRDGIAESLP